MTRPNPTILDRLMVAGLKPELVAAFKDVHRRRTPCHCTSCEHRRAGVVVLPAIRRPEDAA